MCSSLFISFSDENLEEYEEKFVNEFGDRGKKAIKGIKEEKVKKYKDFWIVVGEKDHIVINDSFCSCEDYLYNISSINPEAKFCWHTLAVKLAKALDEFDKIDAWYLDYQEILS